MPRKKTRKPYFVSFFVKGRLGVTKGKRTFDTFNQAQNFAVRVMKQKSANLIKWGTNK